MAPSGVSGSFAFLRNAPILRTLAGEKEGGEDALDRASTHPAATGGAEALVRLVLGPPVLTLL